MKEEVKERGVKALGKLYAKAAGRAAFRDIFMRNNRQLAQLPLAV
jgi:hypothetical protein